MTQLLRWLRFLTIASVLISGTAHAQGVDVRGFVTDSSSGERLPYASVFIRLLNRGCSTNLNGFYLLPNIPIGMYEVTASAVGYTPQTRSLRVRFGEPITLPFRLAVQPIEFSEVVIQAKAKKELMETNTSIHLMDAQDLRKIPVAVQHDLLRAVQILPGIISASDVNAKFYVRGGSGDQNLILLDGIRIYNPYHAFGILSIFDVDIIKATEMYTSTFPAGYGNRLSSVLNVSTRDGTTQRITGKSSVNFLSARAAVEGPVWKNNTLLLTGRKSLFNDSYSRFLKNPVPISFYDAFAKATFLTEGYARHCIEGFISGDDVLSAEADEPDYHWRTSAYGFNISSLIADRLFLDIMLSTSTFKATRDAKKSTVVAPASSTVSEQAIRSSISYYADVNEYYIFGFDIRVPQFSNIYTNSSGIRRNAEASAIETGIWFRYQTTFEPLKIDAGLHLDPMLALESGFTWTGFQPRISVSYRLSPMVRVKASYGIFTQKVITLNNEDDIIPLFEAWIDIPAGLSMERSDHLVAGIDLDPLPALTTSIQGYYKWYPSLMFNNREKLHPVDPDFLNGNGHAYGLETSMNCTGSFFEIYGAYTLGWTTVTAGDLSYPPRFDRRHTINTLIGFRPIENLESSVRVELGSGFPFTPTIGFYDRLSFRNPVEGMGYANETGSPYSILGEKNSSRLPAYVRVDVGTQYSLIMLGIKGTVGIQLTNLLNRQNILYFDRKTGQRINMLPFFPTASLELEF